jgi:hypothetical protein
MMSTVYLAERLVPTVLLISAYLLQLYDGRDALSRKLGRYCSAAPLVLHSTTNHIFIKFRSDASGAGRGFHIRYQTGKAQIVVMCLTHLLYLNSDFCLLNKQERKAKVLLHIL